MKIIYRTLIYLCLIQSIKGQNTEISISFSDMVSSEINLIDGQIQIHQTKKPFEKNNRLHIMDAQIIQGDLLLQYRLKNFRGKERNMNFRVSPYILSSNGERYVVHSKNLNGSIINSYSSDDQNLQLTWSSFIDQYRMGDNEVEIHLDGELYGPPPVDCLNKPTFGKRKLLPHYIIAGGSAGLVIAGNILKSSSDNIYDDYRNEVFDGNTTAIDTYNKANGRHKTGEFLKTTGYIIFAGNAGVLLYRYLNYKKRLKDYNYYCGSFEEAEVSAYSDINGIDNSVGVQLALKF